MKAAGGFAKIWRGVFGHVALRTPVEEAAFMWLIAKAAWQPVRVRYKGKAVHLKRGQLALSLRDFAVGFDWSIGFVQRFTDRLKTESMIETCSDSGVLVITVCNYSAYQDVLRPADSPSDSPSDSKPIQKRDTEQEEEEGKKDSPLSPPKGKKTFLPSDWKPPPVAELTPKAKECARQWPSGAYDTVAEGFAAFWQSRGRMMTDWDATWRGWIIREHWRVMQESRWKAGSGSGEPQPLWKSLA